MTTHIDWLSFTFQSVPDTVGEGGLPYREALNGLLAINETLFDRLGLIGDFVEASGRAPFKASLRSSAAGVSLFYGHKTGLVLVEFSGQGCHWLEGQGLTLHTLAAHRDRVTRIDIAHDWETDTSPEEFAACRDVGRFKSVGDFKSASGQTVYVGSKTGERYARVYRYHPPHPRHKLMRLEIVLRKDAAKAVADYILQAGIHTALLAVGEGFGWKHPLWNSVLEGDMDPIIWRPRERGGSTLRWLYTQVTPAVEKTLQNGDTEGIKVWLTELLHLFYDYDAIAEIDPDKLHDQR